MTSIEQKIVKTININYEAHEFQSYVHEAKNRFRVVIAGRKWGKTELDVMEAFKYLGIPGAMVWWVAPFQSVAMVGWRRFVSMIPPVCISDFDKREYRIHMINGSNLCFKSADNANSLVGEGVDFMILDEASRIREETWLETLRPNLDDPARIGHALFTTTPRGHDWVYQAWLLGLRRIESSWKSWSYEFNDIQGGFPSWTNPYFRPKDLVEAKLLPDKVFLQEYGARFLEDLGAVFRGITEAKTGSLEPPKNEEEYVAGVDWGKSGDFTVVSILNSKGHLVAYDRFRKTSWTLQIERVVNILKEYNASALLDSTGIGDPIFDMVLDKYPNVSPFNLNVVSKPDIIENLAVLIESKDITYPDIPTLLEELSVFGIEQGVSNVRYQAPKGFHDDFVISLALAAWQLKRGSGELTFGFLP